MRLLLIFTSTVIADFRSHLYPWPWFLFPLRHIRVQKWYIVFDERGRSFCVKSTNWYSPVTCIQYWIFCRTAHTSLACLKNHVYGTANAILPDQKTCGDGCNWPRLWSRCVRILPVITLDSSRCGAHAVGLGIYERRSDQYIVTWNRKYTFRDLTFTLFTECCRWEICTSSHPRDSAFDNIFVFSKSRVRLLYILVVPYATFSCSGGPVFDIRFKLELLMLLPSTSKPIWCSCFHILSSESRLVNTGSNAMWRNSQQSEVK